jgi:hypothetical protein
VNDQLKPHEREAVIRETFEAIAAVGFGKWQAEELMAFGYLAGEEDRQHYVKECKKNHFAEFEAMAAGTTDERLLDARAYWIDKANAMGLSEWQRLLSRDDRPWHEEFRRQVDGQEEHHNSQERGGRKR